jgi:hypothetical protein
VQLHDCLSSALDGGVDAQRHATTALHPGKSTDTHEMGNRIGPRASQDASGGDKIFTPNEVLNPDPPARTESLNPLSYPDPGT